MRTLNEREAFDAMVRFLTAYYLRGHSDGSDIGLLLGDLAIDDENRTMDPAAWHDWLDAVKAKSDDGTQA